MSSTDSETTGEKAVENAQEALYDHRLTVELGETIAEDRSDGTPYPMWKAEAGGETAIAENPTAAILRVVEIHQQEGNL
jgi:hypothetical protein